MKLACERLKVNRQCGLATAVSFALRLVIGIILFAALPVYGYDEAPPNNGYLYLDAYARDTDAWQLASSGDSLLSAFQNEFRTDQYGGLLSLSAAIYRTFSPDAHRPLLILILTSFFTALGFPFFGKRSAAAGMKRQPMSAPGSTRFTLKASSWALHSCASPS